MIQTSWHAERPPVEVPVLQVYGIVFDARGRVLVQRDSGARHNLPGGKPEGGESQTETLRREILEESQVSITRPVYLGYQLVVGDHLRSNRAYAQLRYMCDLAGKSPIEPDVASGETYERLFVFPERAIDLLGWGDEPIREAVRLRQSR